MALESFNLSRAEAFIDSTLEARGYRPQVLVYVAIDESDFYYNNPQTYFDDAQLFENAENESQARGVRFTPLLVDYVNTTGELDVLVPYIDGQPRTVLPPIAHDLPRNFATGDILETADDWMERIEREDYGLAHADSFVELHIDVSGSMIISNFLGIPSEVVGRLQETYPDIEADWWRNSDERYLKAFADSWNRWVSRHPE